MTLKQKLKRTMRFWGAKKRSDLQPGVVIASTSETAAVPAPLSLATVYRCVRVLSEAVASLPLLYETAGSDGIYRATDKGMNYLTQVEPQERIGAFEFMRQVVQHLLLRGNCYILPMTSPEGRITRFVLLSAGSVAYTSCPTETYVVNDNINGISGVFTSKQILHIRNFTPNGESGVSVLTSARHTLGIVSRGDAETADRLTNGGGVRGILSSPEVYDGVGYADDGEIEKTSIDVENEFRRGRRIVSIPQTTNFQQLSLSSTDLQFLETRKFEVREICRFFGVNPTFVFDDTSNNYKSAELANAAFLSQTLNPLLRNIENEFQRKLCGPWLEGVARFRFDRAGLFIADRETDVRYKTALLAAGLRTPNELRAAENQPPVEHGDELLVSANLRCISDVHAHNEQPSDNETSTNDNNENEDEKR